MSLTPSQCAAARRLLGWRVSDLADKAHVSPTTVVDFERGKRQPVHNTIEALRRALTAGGVEIVPGKTVRAEARERAIELDDGSIVRLLGAP